MSRLRIAICGGGIGGLCLAVVLKKFIGTKDITIDVYEADAKFAELGTGVTIWERTRSILRTLGMADAFDRRMVSAPVTFRKSDTQEPFDFHNLVVPKSSVALPRNEMLNIMIEELAREQTPFLHTHFSKKLVSYEQGPDGVTVHFADGSAARADVLIGAEGLGSPTRKKMYADLAERMRASDPVKSDELLKVARPSWTGTCVYRTLIDREKLRAAAPHNNMLDRATIWIGKGKHVVSYPVSPAFVNVGYFDTTPGGLGQPLPGPSMVAASREEIMNLYKGWEEDLQVAAKNIDEVSKWAISHVRGLPQYVDGRVALLGDSAHAMSPHFVAGAGQAIEDAYILGRLFTHPSVTPAHISAVLQIYDSVRRPVAADAVERSLQLGFMFELSPDYLSEGRSLEKLCAGDVEELKKYGQEVQDLYRFHWEEMPEQDWELAGGMLGKAFAAQ